MDGSFFTYAMMYRVFDAYLGSEPKDWSADLRKAIEGLEAAGEEAQQKQLAQRVTGTKPSLALRDYAGTYGDSMYGEAKVAVERDRLVVRYGSAFVGELEHWHYDTFRAAWRDVRLGKSFVSFTIGVNGKAAEMKVENLADFGRVPERADSAARIALSEAELAKYAGTFESKSPPIKLEVQILGNSLKAAMEGQPLYTLVAQSATRFQVTGPPDMPAGFYLDFTLEGGRVTSVALVQPDPQPTLTFTRVGDR
jgi:hypothetical protein